ncbi:chloramphenicol acetyltransferase [Flavobacterium aciduliphilum]|uniref:Chloramphenicol O-acetyltransferase type A n=1 Tax=Flavobacterium aciduliphilum TaxID=1101402 RepID=A0A328YHU3_9FLAO|nr:chloramphenicol acetyltransferase [Flavobacterium aciduliphilum]RAR72623.1 chloramphenicol O-acetyltransferase type A [Flavobacterium aciduliphilum]
MKQKLDLDSWNRKEHFLFFKQMEEPFFGIVTTINCTKAYHKAKELGVSFFTYYLHKTLMASNAIESFRYRIIDDEVYLFDQIDASSTILREDNTFGFSLIKYDPDLHVFAENLAKEIERVKQTQGLFTRSFSENLIHFSTLPWVSVTGVSHARSFTWPDSCPKISFDKLLDDDGIKTMSMSIHVHHGLMDGVHLGQFVNYFQEIMDAD